MSGDSYMMVDYRSFGVDAYVKLVADRKAKREHAHDWFFAPIGADGARHLAAYVPGGAWRDFVAVDASYRLTTDAKRVAYVVAPHVCVRTSGGAHPVLTDAQRAQIFEAFGFKNAKNDRGTKLNSLAATQGALDAYAQYRKGKGGAPTRVRAPKAPTPITGDALAIPAPTEGDSAS